MSLRKLLFVLLCSSFALSAAMAQVGAPPPEAPPPFQPWRAWTLHDGDGVENWSAEFVSLGNWGTHVFCHRSNYETGGMLLSAHDADLHASLSRLATGTPNEYWFTVRLYDSLGERWSWTYPQATGGRSALDLSRDGELLVVAIYNPAEDGTDLLVFDPDVPEPVSTWLLPAGVIWSMDLAEEATRAVLGIGNLVHVADVLTGETVWQWDWGTGSLSSVSLTLSADGTLLGYGDHDWRVHVRRWNGSDCQVVLTRNLPESHAGARCMSFSRDNSKCAYGVVYPYPSTVVYTECVAVPSGELLLSDRIESSGTYQNSCLDLVISEDGALVGVAQAGDQTGEQPEFRIYVSSDAYPFANPIFMLNLPGSALNVDVAPDGRTFVLGSREVHINELGAGGRTDLVSVYPDGLLWRPARRRTSPQRQRDPTQRPGRQGSTPLGGRAHGSLGSRAGRALGTRLAASAGGRGAAFRRARRPDSALEDRIMLVKDIMTRQVYTCGLDANAHDAARLMWEHGCGCVPVLDADGRPTGMITDRDICMAAYTQGRPLTEIDVSGTMCPTVQSCRPEDTLFQSERTMREFLVRRLPVLDEAGQIVGLLSLDDIARESARIPHEPAPGIEAHDVVRTLGAVSQPHAPLMPATKRTR